MNVGQWRLNTTERGPTIAPGIDAKRGYLWHLKDGTRSQYCEIISALYCGFAAGLAGAPSRRFSGNSLCARPKLSYARMTRCTR
jgi:hypothetical protein